LAKIDNRATTSGAMAVGATENSKIMSAINGVKKNQEELDRI
jgi:hypothetical protein